MLCWKLPGMAGENRLQDVAGSMSNNDFLKIYIYLFILSRSSSKGQSIDLRQTPQQIDYIRDAVKNDSKPVLFVIKE